MISKSIQDTGSRHVQTSVPVIWLGICVQSLAVVKKLQPKRAFLIGMTHEFEHDLDSSILAEWSARCSFEPRP